MKLAQVKDAILVWGAVSREALSFLKEEKLTAVAECRPYLYGLRHNLALLGNENISCFYCTDNMLGILFAYGKIKRTFIFYRSRRKEGFLCPAGSLYVYLLSKLHNAEIKFIAQGEIGDDYNNDVSKLGGRLFVSKEDLKFVVKAKDELIEY